MAEEFSIIVPVFNRAGIVERTLDSIRQQSYRPIHLIVVDNASTDDTFGVIRRWGERNTSDDFRMSILKESRPGAAVTRNRGLQVATSDKLLFFDSDDTMRPNLVAEVMRAFAKPSGPDIVTWKCIEHSIHGTSRTLHHFPGDIWQKHIYHAVMRTQGYAVKRSFINKAGGWNPLMMVWNDWELGIRLFLAEPKMEHINQTLVDIYCQPQSITGTSFSGKHGEWEKALRRADELFDRAAAKPGADPHVLNKLHRMVDYRRIVLAAQYARESRPDLAHALLKATLANPDSRLNMMQKKLLRLAYHYTRLGLRGAAHFIDPLL